MDPRAYDAVLEVVTLLSRGDVAAALARCPGSRCRAEDLRRELESWSARFTPPPADWRTYAEVIAVARAKIPTWSVVVPMWTAAGRSDLSLELTVTIRGGLTAIEIDDLHVL